MAGCPQIPPDSTSAAASHEFVQPKISICSDHSAPSFSRSRIFHNCTMQQKSAQIIPPPKKKMAEEKIVSAVFLAVFSGLPTLWNNQKSPIGTSYLNLKKSSKPQLLNLDQNLNPLKFSQKSVSLYFKKLKSSISISLEFQSQPRVHPKGAFLTTSLSPACRWPAAAGGR